MSSTINASASVTAPGSLSWETAFAKFRELAPFTQQCLRRAAAARLVECGAFEVGSSDVSHCLFSVYRRCEGDWTAVVLDFVNQS